MTTWFRDRIQEITKLESYKKPEKIPDAYKLDSNENFYISKEIASEILDEIRLDVDLREYPLEQYNQIYEKLSEYHGINKECFSIGNGSDQLIELILSILTRGKRVAIAVPTFSYFINRCQLHNIKLEYVPLLENNMIDENKFNDVAKKSDFIYICSPNNPTSNQYDEEIIERIIQRFDDKLIILDEAYVEFAEYTLTKKVLYHENLIILRTFSKAFGLAGARIGYLITNRMISDIFNSTIQLPYPLNTLSLMIARSMLERRKEIDNVINKIKKERERLYDFLTEYKEFKVTKSNSNFIFFESSQKYNEILETLKNNRVIVKEYGDLYGRRGCIRFTIGNESMNDKFIDSIKFCLQ